MPSAGNALVTSVHSRSTRIGVLSSLANGAIVERQSATIRAASSAKPRSRAGRPTASSKPSERRLGIADHPDRIRIAAPDFERVGVDLHDLCRERRNHPIKGDLIAGIAADIQDQIGRMNDAVGRRCGIAAGHADMQRDAGLE